ncbi:WxcM domain protein [Desulfarculus baarsii DSM 2075]|uniref:WxcM domain protein n=1 Tax=Desulfarculus baarsii (strain ATCC 33931 / DSM 2075 / LMG 7858 / VKM B-1802 / 2st14) TaxID=644282 RepID=E1QDU6_DESB2|nr:WxcM-like domain-containing protein [Desulfarculus baarsii]ADK83732.1 WxcM domain protein [Desulfarculus baarsii DSM 2075]
MQSSKLCHLCAGATIAASARLGDHVVVYPGATVADDCLVAGFTQLWPGVRLERGACLGPGVTIQPPDEADASTVSFGPNCRIGANATILRGVRVGEGAVVEPGSVVAQSVPPHAIVSGAPARITGYVDSRSAQQVLAWRGQAEVQETGAVVRLDVGDVTLHRLSLVHDPRGDLVFGEFARDIPFAVKRYFMVFNVPSEKVRGEHAHRVCHQFLICAKGGCAVVVDDGATRCEVFLDSPDLGLYLPPMTWGTQYKCSGDTLLCVFTSHYYDPADYIRDYAEFLALVHKSPNNAA